MSDKITYVLEVLDKYSVNTKKFKSELLGVKKAAEEVDRILSKGFTSINALPKAVRETNNLASSIDKVTRANQRNATVAINASRSLGNMRKTLAGAYTPIRFNPEVGKYEARTQNAPLSSVRMGGGGLGVSFGGVAKAMGYYAVIDKMAQTPKMIHDVAVEMDGLRAGLGAMIPKVKGLESATVGSEIDYLKNISNKYGFRFNDIKDSYLKMLGTGAKASTVKGITENFGALGSLLNLSADKQKFVMLALQDMLSKKTIQAQELHLQMAALPGGRELFYKAFLNLAKKQGLKDVTEQNYSAKFEEYAGQGRISSEPVIQEVNRIIAEIYGEDFKIKAHTLGKEESRLSNAFYDLGITISDRTKPAMIAAATAATSVVSSVNKWTTDLFATLDYLTESGTEEYPKYKRSISEDINKASEFILKPFQYPGEKIAEMIRENRIKQNANIATAPLDQKIVIEFLGQVPPNMSVRPNTNQNISVKKDATLSPAGGSY